MKKERQFRIVKSGDKWTLQELVEWRWWIFSTKRYECVATSLSGPESLKEYVNNLLQPDGVVWESTKTLTEIRSDVEYMLRTKEISWQQSI